MNSMEIKKLTSDQDFQTVINNINDYLKKINDYQVNHQTEFGLPIEELGQFRKSWFYHNWQTRFRKVQSFNGLGLTGVINTPNTTFEEWMWWFHEWSESFNDDYNKFKELMFQALLVIEKHLEGVDTELQDHENRITDNTNRLDNDDTKLNEHEQRLDGHDQRLDGLDHEMENHVDKINNQSIFYDAESKATFDYVNHSHTYLVKVNKHDADGNLIMPRVESITSMNAAGPHSYARHSLSTVTINAGLTIPVDKSTGDFTTTAGNNWQWTQAIIISHGTILNDLDAHTARTLPDHYEYLAIKSDGSLVGYKANSTTALQMINEGVTEAFLTFWRIIDHGAKVSSDTFVDMTSGSTNTGVKMPSILFGEFQDGTYGFLACDGRTSIDFGMDYVQWQDYAASLGFKNAWNIDGGGSASLNYKGSKLNKAVDTNNLGAVVDRLIGYVLTINKPGVEPTQADRAFIRSAEVKDELIQSRQIEKDWIKKVGVIGHSAIDITTDDDFTKYMNDRIDEALAYPAMERGSVIVGKMFLAAQLIPQWFPSLSPHRSSRFVWTLTTPPYGQDSTSFSPDNPNRFISLELRSLSNPSEIYYRRFDMRTHTWGTWVERGVPMALNLTVTVSNSIVSDVSGSVSADGTVIIRGTVYQAIGNTWTKIITGAPIGRFDGTLNPVYAYPTNFAGGSLRLFVDNSTGDVYARFNWDGAGKDASLGFTISYHSGQLIVSDQTYVSQ